MESYHETEETLYQDPPYNPRSRPFCCVLQLQGIIRVIDIIAFTW